MFVVRVNINHMAKLKRLFNNFGGTRVKVPQSLRSSDLYLRAVTAIFIYLNLHVMRVTDEKLTRNGGGI